MPLLSNDGDLGSWQSSNLELLTIDSISGVGRALSPGHVRVKHSLAALAQGEIQLDIKPVSEVHTNQYFIIINFHLLDICKLKQRIVTDNICPITREERNRNGGVQSSVNPEEYR